MVRNVSSKGQCSPLSVSYDNNRGYLYAGCFGNLAIFYLFYPFLYVLLFDRV